MDTRQLEYFVAVAEELNFTRAARRLFAVQSTVSAGIRSLEHELGAALFERSSKRVELTSAGVALLPEAHAAIEAIDRVRGAVTLTKRGIRGRLRVGIFTHLDFVDLPALFGEFHERYPLVDLQLGASPSGSTGLADNVRRGRIDVAFMGLPAQDLAGFRVLELASSAFVAVLPAAHPLAGKESVSLAELAGELWVDAPEGFGNRIAVERAFAAAGLGRTVKAEVADLGEVPRFVRAGLGVAVLPLITYRPTPGIVLLPLDDGIGWMLSAISRPKPSPAIAALLELLAERMPLGVG
ncbi:LysR family transcriptional regulator [Amycolatopsis sp.]|uniref:LysR family transcriptional regulator n=1 Tax=Amycolatopsis sp. TaxID=37632 RepID=UPI002DFD3FED|nr:LysR family transcriptional regulator [Amycolatopsis sp.]